MATFWSMAVAYLALLVTNIVFLLLVEAFAPELRANLWAAGYPDRSMLFLFGGFVGFTAGVRVGGSAKQ